MKGVPRGYIVLSAQRSGEHTPAFHAGARNRTLPAAGSAGLEPALRQSSDRIVGRDLSQTRTGRKSICGGDSNAALGDTASPSRESTFQSRRTDRPRPVKHPLQHRHTDLLSFRHFGWRLSGARIGVSGGTRLRMSSCGGCERDIWTRTALPSMLLRAKPFPRLSNPYLLPHGYLRRDSGQTPASWSTPFRCPVMRQFSACF